MSDIFHEVMDQNAGSCSHIEVEPGILMPGRVLGVCIDIQGADGPIFISADQLRAMADAVDQQ